MCFAPYVRRTPTLPACSITVDMGANWIEGVAGNPLAALVNATRARLFPTPADGATQFIYEGHDITDEVRDVAPLESSQALSVCEGAATATPLARTCTR